MGAIRNFLAYYLVVHILPGGWRGEPWRSIELWLLPYAGAWAHRDSDYRGADGDNQ